MTQESAAIELASYLIKQNADAISSKTEKTRLFSPFILNINIF